MKDLNLLLVFEALYNERSVTGAARKLGLSQSAVSLSLKRLREEYQDKLFVLVNRAMEPTPLASAISGRLLGAVAMIRETRRLPTVFDFANAERTFNVRARDIGEVVFLPNVLERLWKVAPRVSVRTIFLDPHETLMGLASGRLDLAIGYLPLDAPDIRRRPLMWENKYVCVMRRDHPLAGRPLTEEEFFASNHLLVEYATGVHKTLERCLIAGGARDRIKVRLPQYLAAPFHVLRFDLLWCLPEALAAILTQHFALDMQDLPFKLDIPTEVSLYWHERYHNDLENRWLRSFILETVWQPTHEVSSEEG
jgi:DNA-binding transcriptional LysR family regulator